MLTIPDVRQATDYDCGTAAVDAVRRFWGVPERGPVALANPVQGMAPDTVEALLRATGFSVLSGTMTLDDLSYLTQGGRPVLCPVTLRGDGHWVVVSGIAPLRVCFHDPARGPDVLRPWAWARAWTDHTRFGHYFPRWGICPFLLR